MVTGPLSIDEEIEDELVQACPIGLFASRNHHGLPFSTLSWLRKHDINDID